MQSKKKSAAIIGAGPAGCMCAYYAANKEDVTLFDAKKPLHTLLYTGGGRCNLAYAEYDFKELTKSYPRGEKFLYSIFSRFSTTNTIEFFKEIGVETYVQDDLRIFPVSNSAKEVREKFLDSIKSCKFKTEKVINIKKGNNKFLLTTELNNYYFDRVVIATGGHSGFSLAEKLGHKIIEPKPSLTGLITAENFNSLKGVSIKKVLAKVYFEDHLITKVQDDLLFTGSGISGPLAYKISSICARMEYSKQKPLFIKLDFVQKNLEFQNQLNSNPKKDIKNLVAEYTPKSVAEYILNANKIDLEKKCCNIDGKTRDLIIKGLSDFNISVIEPEKEGEIVTSGGVCLDEINPKTMESKITQGLYFCGEVINIDGYCGGFNLHNCWATGSIAGTV